MFCLIRVVSLMIGIHRYSRRAIQERGVSSVIWVTLNGISLLGCRIGSGMLDSKLIPKVEVNDSLRYLVPLSIDEHVLVRDPAFLSFLVYDFNQTIIRLPWLSDVDHFDAVFEQPFLGLQRARTRSR